MTPRHHILCTTDKAAWRKIIQMQRFCIFILNSMDIQPLRVLSHPAMNTGALWLRSVVLWVDLKEELEESSSVVLVGGEILVWATAGAVFISASAPAEPSQTPAADLEPGTDAVHLLHLNPETPRTIQQSGLRHRKTQDIRVILYCPLQEMCLGLKAAVV